jgi:spoIIIJ-associated protein
VKKARIKVTVPEVVAPVAEASVREVIREEAPSEVEQKEEIATVKKSDQKSDEKPGQKVDILELARETAQHIVSFIIDEATVRAEKKSDRIRLTIEGGNSGLLIGKHGRTLEALQYLVQKVVQNKGDGKERVSVDVEGYRERRKTSLTQLALRLGEKVKKSGKPATINPMNAYDRRIVHVALKDDAKLRTQSMGTGALRKLVIFPQRKRRTGKEVVEEKEVMTEQQET